MAAVLNREDETIDFDVVTEPVLPRPDQAYGIEEEVSVG
jgi:hypothetical protein